jgi:hypothetical protein
MVTAQAAGDDDLTLFRDVALVRQVVTIDIPAGGVATVKIAVASGITADQVLVVDRGGLDVRGIHAAVPTTVEPIAPPVAEEPVDSDGTPDPDAPEGSASGSSTSTSTSTSTGPMTVGAPAELSLDVAGARPGNYRLALIYVTDRLRWDAAYTMTANEEHDHVILRGALAIRNATGVSYRANAHVVDTDLAMWRSKVAEKLAADLAGGPAPTAPMAATRDLGRLVAGQGETRVDLLAGSQPRAMHSVLVYDPVGTKLDNPSAQPLFDTALGANVTSTHITESFEVERDLAASEGMPAGPVRLLERRADGSLTVLGEARLFDAASRVANVDTIAVGTSEGVTARRLRRELTTDRDNKRLVEEFEIDINNGRPAPAAVLVREHLYRGQNWSLAYHSATNAAKEGPQQIALRTTVPAKAKSKLLYVVVYTW